MSAPATGLGGTSTVRGTGARRAVTHRAARRRRWTRSWAAALRLARRDALRHGGTSVLIMAMVALPVLLVTGASTYVATTTVEVAESLPAALGRGQARLVDAGFRVDQQSLDARSFSGGETPVTPYPGRSAGQPWTADQLSRLNGAPVSAVGYPRVTVRTQAQGVVAGSALALDPALLASSGLATLTAGRWPTSDREIVITPHGQAAGLPTSGSVTVTDGAGTTTEASVVGVVTAQDAEFRPLDLVVGPRFAGLSKQYYPEFLLFGDTPVTWADVHRLNGYGLTVLSPTVLADPPPAEDPTVVPDPSDGFGSAVILLVCLALVLETTLLAGPAFAVSAARRRRALALVAANGGEQRQVARYVLAQGLALGGTAAVAGGILGTAGGWVVARVVAHRFSTVSAGPYDLYPALTVTVVVAAVVASLVASGLPARGAARLAVAATLSTSGRPRARRVSAVVGTLLLVLGATTLPMTRVLLHDVPALVATAAAAVAMIIGAGVAAPVWLAVVGRLLRPAPVALRMAGRDLVRSSSRSVPAVAAIMVAVAVLMIFVVGNASIDRRGERDYTPQLSPGHGQVISPGSDSTAETSRAVAEIHRLHPDWRVGMWGRLGGTDVSSGGAQVPAGRSTVVAVVPQGCTAAAALAPLPADTEDTGSGTATSSDHGCQRLGSNARREAATRPSWGLGSAPLTDEQRRVLSAGGLLIASDRAAGLVVGDVATVAVGTVSAADGSHPRLGRTVRVPAALVTSQTLAQLTFTRPGEEVFGALAASDLVTSAFPVALDRYEIADPDGPISRADQAALANATTAEISVERGYESASRVLILILCATAGALAALAAIIATALAQVELRPDLSTLSAVGATGGFRRRLAVAQAVVLAVSGVVAGLLVGLGPAIAFGLALTTERTTTEETGLTATPAVVDIPWLTIGLVAFAIPVLSAVVATLVTGKAPTLNRRET